MPRYYSTCPAGLEPIVEQMAQEALPGFRLSRLLGGALIYDADTAPSGADSPRCFANSYELLAALPDMELGKALARLAADRAFTERANEAMARYGFRSFRCMFSQYNQLTSVPAPLRARLERQLTAARLDRLTPDTELLLLRRSEGMTLALLRLTRRPATRQRVGKGELMPELAQAMVFLTGPEARDVFMDPFCGHGALGVERARSPYSQIMLFDIDQRMADEARARLRGRKGTLIERRDALELSGRVESASVTAIVTDPPWGLFEPLPLPAPEFYRRMLEEFARALVPGGRLVLLSADKQELEAAFRAQLSLELTIRHDILVSGKKAAIYRAQKRANGGVR